MTPMTARRPTCAVIAAAVLTLGVTVSMAQAPRPTTAAPQGAKIDAAKLFAEQCALCHGKKGEGTAIGRPLNQPLMNGESVDAITEVLTKGIEGSAMASFAKKLTPAQIAALAKYVADIPR